MWVAASKLELVNSTLIRTELAYVSGLQLPFYRAGCAGALPRKKDTRCNANPCRRLDRQAIAMEPCVSVCRDRWEVEEAVSGPINRVTWISFTRILAEIHLRRAVGNQLVCGDNL